MRKKNKRVYGVGINDADYRLQEFITTGYENGKPKQKLIWICPFYNRWKNMLQRCYSDKFQEKYQTYIGCSVCEEWLTFSNFKAWMEKQQWEGKHLDKDLLFPGNKVYSPSTSVFVDERVNTFLTEHNPSRGEYLIGVCWNKRDRKFMAQCGDLTGRQKKLGYFNTELEAHKAWFAYKLKMAYKLASEQTDTRIAKALIERYENYTTPSLFDKEVEKL